MYKYIHTSIFIEFCTLLSILNLSTVVCIILRLLFPLRVFDYFFWHSFLTTTYSFPLLYFIFPLLCWRIIEFLTIFCYCSSIFFVLHDQFQVGFEGGNPESLCVWKCPFVFFGWSFSSQSFFLNLEYIVSFLANEISDIGHISLPYVICFVFLEALRNFFFIFGVLKFHLFVSRYRIFSNFCQSG